MQYPWGWHLGNERPMTDIDWRILELVRPGAVLFLGGQQIGRGDVERILAINPACHVFVRGYLPPEWLGDKERPNYAGVLPGYFDDCRCIMDDFSEVIPAGQKHFQIFNEQNMPRHSQWEGFGSRPDDMRAFDEWFCRGYDLLKAHDPSYLIGWTPLTPGNRDVWFNGDVKAVPYYMHGPEAAKPGATPQDVRAAIQSGPCRESLMRADEYLAHVYIHEGKDAWRESWRGARFARLMSFLPKPMDVWITEAGFPTKVHLDQPWSGAALVEWYKMLAGFTQVKSTCLWALGTHQGSIWYDGDKPRQEVYTLAEYTKTWKEPDVPEPIQSPPIKIDGRGLTLPEFVQHVESLPALDIDRVFMHHTASDPQTWAGRATLDALKAWYETKLWKDIYGRVHRGWTAGPHVFVHNLVWLFTDLRQDGVGVVGHNTRTRHVEMVWNGNVREPHGEILDNTIAVLAILLYKAGLSVEDGLAFHRDEQSTDCPGQHTTKALIYPRVEAWLSEYKRMKGEIMNPERNEAIRNIVWNNLGKAAGIPYTRDNAFPQYARQHALGAPLTPELYDLPIDGRLYVAQGFANGIVLAVKGDWGHIERVSW